MKNILTFLFFTIGFSASAQNWMPIHTNEKHSFGDSPGNITTTLWIDSIKIINGETVYYMNRVMKECVGCPHPPNFYQTYLINQPSFLLSRFVKTDSAIIFRDIAHNFVLPFNTAIDSLFVFDSVNNISGKLLEIKDSIVMGQQDSVRVYQLSNVSRVVISKNLGILKFPWLIANTHIELAGLENSGFGIQTPMFESFFSYNTGDIFEYNTEAEDHWPIYKSFERVTVLQKLHSGDTIQYQMNRKGVRYKYMWNTVYDTIYTDTLEVITYINQAGSFFNKYVGEFLGLPECGSTYKPVSVGINSTFQCRTKNISGYHFLVGNEDTVYTTGAPGFITGCWEPLHGMAYGQNVGLIFEHTYNTDSSPYAYSYTKTLKGALLNGIMYGSFTYIPFLGIETNGSNANPVAIYPNPAQNTVHLMGIPENYREINCSVFNGTGVAVISTILHQPQWQLDISGLPQGLYYMQIQLGSEVIVRKLVKL